MAEPGAPARSPEDEGFGVGEHVFEEAREGVGRTEGGATVLARTRRPDPQPESSGRERHGGHPAAGEAGPAARARGAIGPGATRRRRATTRRRASCARDR
jgi:hypothetical protein